MSQVNTCYIAFGTQCHNDRKNSYFQNGLIVNDRDNKSNTI